MKKDIKPIKLTAKVVMSFEFAQLMMKLHNSPTSNIKAGHINHIYSEIEKYAKPLRETFKKDIIDVYAEKDEKGNLVPFEGAGGEGFKIIEGKIEEFHKASEAYENTPVEIKWRPLTPDTLADIRLTGKEIQLLGPLYVEENGPGLPPHLQSVINDAHPN